MIMDYSEAISHLDIGMKIFVIQINTRHVIPGRVAVPLRNLQGSEDFLGGSNSGVHVRLCVSERHEPRFELAWCEVNALLEHGPMPPSKLFTVTRLGLFEACNWA